MSELFDIEPTKHYSMNNIELFQENGTIPVITNSSLNNGISGYTNLEANEKGNIITFSDTTTDETIFYQPKDFVGYSHVQGVCPKTNSWNKESLLFVLTLFRKNAKDRFDFGIKFNRAIVNKMKINIPLKNNEIDYDFMSNIIKIIQKLVIKDIVLYSNRKLEMTKSVINS